jgi:hypothetical protein
MLNAADLRRTLDDDLGDCRLRQRLDDELPDLEVFEQQPTIVLAFREPAAVQVRLICRRSPTGEDF